MAKRKSTRRNSRKGRGGAPTGRWVALGVAGILSLGWIVTRGSGEGEAPLPLSTTPGEEEAADPAHKKGAGPAAPRALVASLKRLGAQGHHPLIDLRQLAVEFSHTDAGEQARLALGAEANKRLIEARAHKNPTQALRAMTRAYLATIDADARRALRAEAEDMARAAIAHPGCPLVSSYVVKPGDVLARIARRHKTEYRFVKRLSGLERDFLKVGQRLKLPRGASEVVVFKNDFELVILLDGCMLRAFDVATGKAGRTPEGRFLIGTKQVNPTWYSPEGKVFPFGSEGNVLGTRWLAFQDTDQHKGFGIHGTKFPESIGTEASMGCLRMRNAEVEVAYDLIPGKSKVRIVR